MKIPRLRQIERDPWLLSLVEGKSVLHVGCTDYPLTRERVDQGRLLHQRLQKAARSIVGVDIDVQGIQKLGEMMPDLEFHAHDAERLDECPALQGRQFDVVLCPDVLEHVSNDGLFLGAMRSFIGEGGQLVITTPSAFSIKRFAANLFGTEHVHSDHTSYYSISTLSQILARTDYAPVEWFGFQWVNATAINRLANALSAPFLFCFGARCCDELALVCKKKS
jgi:2-polyprenyl-3-methyl-5-hydroxy-6-metoxy-1,4-benzoquinol methylase